jgi:hypothetical protein
VITVRGTWTARVRQEFEVEVESEDEIQDAIDTEIRPHAVVELLDIEVEVESRSDG